MVSLFQNILPKYVTDIKSIYDNTHIVLNKRSPFRVNQGLGQGCGLSPILFDIYINSGMAIIKS